MLAPDEMKPPANEGNLVQCNVRMPQSAVDAFEEWSKEVNAEAGWNKFTRSDLMRDTLLAGLKQREAAKAAPKGEKKARKR